MISTYFSNSYVFLKRLFIEELIAERKNAAGPGAVFGELEVLVASEAVKDDLMRSIAADERLGIVGGIRFVSTQAWLDRALHAARDVRAKARRLDWALWSILSDEEFLNRPECARLKHYIEASGRTILWNLVGRLAALFQTYAAYRPDWLWSWAGIEAGDKLRLEREERVLAGHPDTLWQKALWRELLERRDTNGAVLWPGAESFLAFPKDWKKAFDKKTHKDARLFVFDPKELPPMALPCLMAEGCARAISLYVSNPCSAYWFAPGEQKEGGGFAWFRRNAAARRALIDRIWNFVALDTTPPIIEDDLEPTDKRPAAAKVENASRLGDLLKLKVSEGEEHNIYIEPGEGGFLHAVQKAVLFDDESRLPGKVEEDDGSFLVVRAPNVTREVEALCDWIAGVVKDAEEKGNPCGADDILVVTPDIDAMAGVISAVMTSLPAESAVSYHIAGQSEIDINSAAAAAIAAMRFASGRAERADFDSLIEMPALIEARASGEVDPVVISQWLACAGYRWGINDKHARHAVEKGLAQYEGEEGGRFEGTLERALERLLAGELVSEPGVLAGDVLALLGTEISGWTSPAEAPKSFEYLLAVSRVMLQTASWPERARPDEWLEIMRLFADSLFAGYAASGEMLGFVLEAAANAAVAREILGEQEIDFETWCASLEKTLRTTKSLARATGRVTFARTGDFDGIACRAIAVIGLNDGGNFPGSNARDEFDLTAAQKGAENVCRRGDKDSRRSNRGIFLNLLLNARDYFYCSYVTGSGHTPANPSIVLQDLLEATTSQLSRESLSRIIRTAGILQASPASFDPAAGILRSRRGASAQALVAAQQSNYSARPEIFADSCIAADCGSEMTLVQFLSAVISPGNWAMKALGIKNSGESAVGDAPINRFAAEDYLFETNFRRRVLVMIESGAGREDVENILKYDPTVGEQSSRIEAAQEMLNGVDRVLAAFNEVKEELPVEVELPGRILEIEGIDEGGTFTRLKLPTFKACQKDGEEGERVILQAGFSSRDPMRKFLTFAAAALAAVSAGEPAVDMLFVSAQSDVKYRWSLDNFKEKDEDGVDVLCRILAGLFNVINAHANALPAVQGKYDPALFWRGYEEMMADASNETLLDKLEKLAGFFDAPVKKKGGKKAKFNEVMEVFEALVQELVTAADRRKGERA